MKVGPNWSAARVSLFASREDALEPRRYSLVLPLFSDNVNLEEGE